MELVEGPATDFMGLDGDSPSTNSTQPLRRTTRKRTSSCFTIRIDSKRQKPMTGAERSKKWREQIKDYPDLYAAHRKCETARVQAIRKSLTEEQRLKYNIKSKERTRRYRRKQKELGIVKPKKSKVLTRTERENLRKLWRLQKHKQRQAISTQKRRRINEQRRRRYKVKKGTSKSTQSHEHNETRNSPGAEEGAFCSSIAQRKAICRAKKSLPKSAKQFSIVVNNLISSATPTKKIELHKNLDLSPKSKKKFDILQGASSNFKENLISMKKTKTSMLQKRYMAYSLLKNAKNSRQSSRGISKYFGFSTKFLHKVEKLDDLESRKRRKDALSNEATATVDVFYDRSDLVRTLPNATKTGVKKVLECSMRRMYDEFRKDHQDLKISYSKFVSLKPQSIQPMSKNKFIACLCEYCVNMELKIEALQTLRKRHTQRVGDRDDTVNVPVDKLELSKMTTCETATKQCIDRKCDRCAVNNINDMLTKLTNGEEKVSWMQWERTKYRNASGKETVRMMKISKDEESHTFCETLKCDLESFSRHLLDAKWQSTQFSNISKNVPQNTVVICCDFAENFACQYQDEAQGAHWAYDQVTIYPVMCYYICQIPECDKIVEQSVLIISDDHNHDSHAVHHYAKIAIESLKSKGIRVLKLVQFSDGAPSQFKGKTNFADLAYSSEDFNCEFEKHFFGSRHGKGPCDREIGTVKRSALLAVKSRRNEITNAKTFYEYCMSTLERPKKDEHSHFIRTSKYVTVGDIERDRPERTLLRAVKGTRSYHCFRSTKSSETTKVIQSRERSCFCKVCLGIPNVQDNCQNRDMTGEWISHNLDKPGNRGVQRRAKCDARYGAQQLKLGRGQRGRVRQRGGRVNVTNRGVVEVGEEREVGPNGSADTSEEEMDLSETQQVVPEKGQRGRGQRGRARQRGRVRQRGGRGNSTRGRAVVKDKMVPGRARRGRVSGRGRAVIIKSSDTDSSEMEDNSESSDSTTMEMGDDSQSSDTASMDMEDDEESGDASKHSNNSSDRIGSAERPYVNQQESDTKEECSPLIPSHNSCPCNLSDILDMPGLQALDDVPTSDSALDISFILDSILGVDWKATSPASCVIEAPASDAPSPASCVIEAPASCVIEAPASCIIEAPASDAPSPASCVIEAPASCVIEAPASCVIEAPASCVIEAPASDAPSPASCVIEAPASCVIEAPASCVIEAPASDAPSPASCVIEAPASCVIEAPASCVIEAPASCVIEAPASCAIEAPASCIIEAPASCVIEAPASCAIEAPASCVIEAPACVIEAPASCVIEAPASCAIEAPASCAIEAPASCAIEAPASCVIEAPASCVIEAPASCAIEAPASCAIEAPASCVIEAPASCVIEAPASCVIEAPASCVIEAPASCVIEAPASCVIEAPASCVIEAPASCVIEAPASCVIEAPASCAIEAPASCVIEAPASCVIEAPASCVIEAPASCVIEAPASDVSEAPSERVNLFTTGTYIAVKHGHMIYPAVIEEWPYVRFFHKQNKRLDSLWVENDIRNTVFPSDVYNVLAVPNVHMMGSRILYSFADLSESGTK